MLGMLLCPMFRDSRFRYSLSVGPQAFGIVELLLRSLWRECLSTAGALHLISNRCERFNVAPGTSRPSSIAALIAFLSGCGGGGSG